MPASRKNRSVREARRADCLISRSCSAAVLPNAYSSAELVFVIPLGGCYHFRRLRVGLGWQGAVRLPSLSSTWTLFWHLQIRQQRFSTFILMRRTRGDSGWSVGTGK